MKKLLFSFLVLLMVLTGASVVLADNPDPDSCYLGKWSGRWDGRWLVRFVISKTPSGEITADYEYEQNPGQTPDKFKGVKCKIERGRLKILDERRIEIKPDGPDKAKAYGEFRGGKVTRSALLTRG